MVKMGVAADFSGYATKADIVCTDGRTIAKKAFQHMDGLQVPLVWSHSHKDPENVLGHAILEAVEDGVRAHGFFNNTPRGKVTKELVRAGNIDSLSIYANELKERLVKGAKEVLHGTICEVSLVIKGANKGAKIDQVRLAHGDGFVEDLDDEVVIHMDIPIDFIMHEDEDADEDDENLEHAEGELTLNDVYESLNDDQKNLLHFMVATAQESKNDTAGDDAAHADIDDEAVLAHTEGTTEMTAVEHNVFAQNGTVKEKNVISHADVQSIFARGKKLGSFKEAINEFLGDKGLSHGIDDIEYLFPDAKAITNAPEFDKRRTEWVAGVLGGTHKTPFTRLKTVSADLTQDEARAKGYIKDTYKKQEWIGITKRTTGPATIYKKQQLSRDDILDINDFNVVDWLMGEMRLMLEEEIARAILISDGREVEDEDKIKDPEGAASGDGLRSILYDNELYVTTLNVTIGANYDTVVDGVMAGMEYYKGTGTPTFYTTIRELNKFMMAKDTTGRRLYESHAAVAEALGVSKIVTVEPMNDVDGLIGIIVNLSDYNIGTDKGGELTSFEDFDIDYNTYKYLLETRLSGALMRIKSALVIYAKTTGTLATPTKPTFVSSTGVVTIPTVTGVTYKNFDTDVTITAGAMTALAAGASIKVYAAPSSGSYYFKDTQIDGPWTFKRPEA